LFGENQHEWLVGLFKFIVLGENLFYKGLGK